MKDYEVIVVGAGHAGLEAAFACAHKGHSTLIVTFNLDKMGNMPCNPSIGGSAKGIVVREIDALGGMMGIAADHHYLQMKMLNTGKGPGVQCLRAQQDKLEYPAHLKELVLKCENLDVIQGEVISIIHDDKIKGVELRSGEKIYAKAIILATGTYMEAKIFRGNHIEKVGPDGDPASIGLSQCLRDMGLETYRLKTGTPPRIAAESIDFTKASIQPGTKGQLAFSYETEEFIPVEEQIPCYLIYTTTKTHDIIRGHLNDSALYSGNIVGTGPRYCPSIESKIVTFADKERHQLFLEPESRYTNSIYVQGFSTSMPEEVQVEMVHSLPGFENAKFLKYAYAIEYDALHTEDYGPTLEIKKWPGLYIAGQICGTSGYEEAAALGLMAGINASLKLEGRNPFILRRDQAYIGVMIDDLVTKGTTEPYRLMSSRAEFRLILRHDNADLRLTGLGHQIGLISEARYSKFLTKKANMEKAIEVLKNTWLGKRPEVEQYLQKLGYGELKGGIQAFDFLKRPLVKYADLVPLIPELANIELNYSAIEEIEVITKFEGYIVKQIKEAQNMARLEEMKIPQEFDFLHMDGLALEARQKLDKIRPLTIGQASRISGVNPSDVSILILNIKRYQQEHE